MSDEKLAFLTALEELEKANPADIISRLFRVFESIGRMDEVEVTAAYQAIKHVAWKARLYRGDVEQLLDMAEARMFSLYEEARAEPNGPRTRVHKLSGLFSVVLDFPIHQMSDANARLEFRARRLP